MARSRLQPADQLVDEQAPAEGPVNTDPGCLHPECVLEHPHAGPAVLAVVDQAPDQAAVDVDEQAVQRVRDAEAELAAARAAAAAQLPGGGYVIATERLYVPGGARAHNPGDRVPVGNVQRNGWQAQVRPPADGE